MGWAAPGLWDNPSPLVPVHNTRWFFTHAAAFSDRMQHFSTACSWQTNNADLVPSYCQLSRWQEVVLPSAVYCNQAVSEPSAEKKKKKSCVTYNSNSPDLGMDELFVFLCQQWQLETNYVSGSLTVSTTKLQIFLTGFKETVSTRVVCEAIKLVRPLKRPFFSIITFLFIGCARLWLISPLKL